MRNKSIKRTRMISYFVDAASTIIKNEGISGITIRKVADMTGYNSATLYNYFDNLDHLICLAALKFMSPYTSNLDNELLCVNSALEKNLKVWEIFCHHSFKHPEIYEAIFFAHFDKERNSDYLSQYYDLFPADAPKGDLTLTNMLSRQNIYDRTHILLEDCSTDGFFKEEDLSAIEEMTILLYKGMLSKALNAKNISSSKEHAITTMKYIRQCYKGFLQEGMSIDL